MAGGRFKSLVKFGGHETNYPSCLIGVSKTKNSANTAALFCRKDRTLRLLLSLQNRFNLSP